MLQLKTNLNNPDEIKQVLNELVELVSSRKLLEDHLEEYPFIYPQFGAITDGEFEEFSEETEKLREEEQIAFDDKGQNYYHEVPYITSESLFFRKAASYKELHSMILNYVDGVIKYSIKNELLWSHDETPAGTDAIESLAFSDSKYIQKYIEFLRINDMDHEVYQNYGIGRIIQIHGFNKDTLHLLAVRLGEGCGQHGEENLMHLLENSKLGDYLKVEINAKLFLKLLTEEFKKLMKKHKNDDEIREIYTEIYEGLFQEYPVILNGVEKMKR